MARPRILTDEERKIARARWQRNYRQRVYTKARACDMYEKGFTKVARRLGYSTLVNIILLIACVLGWIF